MNKLYQPWKDFSEVLHTLNPQNIDDLLQILSAFIKSVKDRRPFKLARQTRQK